MIGITSVARRLSQLNKNVSDLLPKNRAANNDPHLPKKLLPYQKQRLHSTMLLASKKAQASSNQSARIPLTQDMHISPKCSYHQIRSLSTLLPSVNKEKRNPFTPLRSTNSEVKADSYILNCDIEVTRVGEAVRVKPSEEIGNKESIYTLTKFDQNIAPVPMKMINLYKSPPKGDEDSVSKVVRTSLSRVLSHYYPLAGKLGISPDGNLVLECTNEGVMFMEAEANCVLDDVMPYIHYDNTMEKFMYDVQGNASNAVEIPQMTVQVTRFQCGGFAVAVVMSHCLCDGISLVHFFENWGLIARELPLNTPPFLDRSILKNLPNNPPHPGVLQLKEKTKTDSVYDNHPLQFKSFVFNEEKILMLKQRAMEEKGYSDSAITKCSAFEVLTAFLWRERTKAFQVDSNKKIKLFFAMDCRPIFNPPLPNGFFGNVITSTHTSCTAGDLLENDLSYGVKLIQQAKKMVNEDYIRSYINYFEETMFIHSSSTSFFVSSECNLAYDEMDFGWGKAVYGGDAVLPISEVAAYYPFGENKKGVIVRMGLPSSVIKAFEENLTHI